MAKERIEARINVSQTAKGKREVARVKRDLKDITRSARTAKKESDKAQTAAASAQPVNKGTRLRNFFGRLRARGPNFSLTSEGLQAGAFKINETGLAVEGVWTKVGGPALFAAGFGRIGSAVTGGIVSARERKKEAQKLGLKLDLGDIVQETVFTRLVDLARVPLKIGGIEQIVTNIAALVTGDSTEKVRQLGLEKVFRSIKDSLTPDSVLELIRAQVKKQVKESLKRLTNSRTQSTLQQLQDWGIPSQQALRIFHDLDVAGSKQVKLMEKAQIEMALIIKDHGTDGSDFK